MTAKKKKKKRPPTGPLFDPVADANKVTDPNTWEVVERRDWYYVEFAGSSDPSAIYAQLCYQRRWSTVDGAELTKLGLTATSVFAFATRATANHVCRALNKARGVSKNAR